MSEIEKDYEGDRPLEECPLEECPHAAELIVCQHCQHEWAAVYPIDPDAPYGCQGCIDLECPNCHKRTKTVKAEPPFHFVITQMNGATWVKPSKPASRLRVIGLLTEALDMLHESANTIISPDVCDLRIWITVDDSQTPDED